MTVLEKGNITIHTENIFPIIKKSLYTDHEIFLRELISNAVDAISKLKMASLAGEVSTELPEPEISLAIDAEKKTLAITDNGIGLTADEVKKYINQVAFSSAEEFVSKYQKSANDLIGHFGLGFYSAFMVAKQVEIDTLSYQAGAQAVHWICDGSPEFELTESTRSQVGTTITLTLLDDEEEYLEPSRVRQLVKTYSDFLSIPIKFENEVINKQKAPWKESPQNLTDEDYLEFYRYLYPFQEDPLLWVHLNTDYPFLLNGILYFPKLRPDVDVSKGQIKLFCNQVFVSDHCEEIIPDFLMPLRGVIDSPDIPLNVSRSALTNHRTVRRIADFISKKVADRLKTVYKNNAAEYIRCWEDVGTFVKYGSLKDEKFKDQVKDILIYPTTYTLPALETEAPKVEVAGEDDAWQDVASEADSANPYEKAGYTTLISYLERNKDKHENRVFYATDKTAQATYVELYKNQGLEVLYLDSFIDTNYFIPFLERENSEVKFARVDAELEQSLLKDDKAAEIVDPTTNKTRSEQIKEIFEKALAKSTVTVRAESLKGEDPQSVPPAVVLLPEEMRRFRDMIALNQPQGSPGAAFPEQHVLVVNTAHPLIENIRQLSQGSIIQEGGESPSAELANLLVNNVYDLALLAQKGFDADGVKSFVERSNKVLTRLTQ
jgi:molecular chaperone HtpG